MCHDTYSAHQGVEHDNINVLVLGARARVVGVEPARELIRAFLNANFSGEERHLRRIRSRSAAACGNAPASPEPWRWIPGS